MCGIFGMIANENVVPMLLKGIKRLEYRGYDSVGMAVLYEGSIEIKKGAGQIHEVNRKLKFENMGGNIGMTHTRWSTHGKASDNNAHPHHSQNKDIVIVHNGIIDNFIELKKDLEKKGYNFKSETDSEVIAHYFEDKIKTNSIKEAIKDFLDDAKGTFAILLINKNEEKIYAIKRDSPLVLGILDDKVILASDVYAFSDMTNKAIFFDNDEFAEVSNSSYAFFDKNGKEKKKKIKEFKWEHEESDIKEHKHYMIKEIMEEPAVVKRLLFSLENDQKDVFQKLIRMIKKSKKTIFVASGTSYHASLLGAYYFHKCGVDVQTLVASEFQHFATVDKDTLIIPITQSGETMDVIEALKYCADKKAKIFSIVNVPHSSIQRMSNASLNILAGQEICVAATKSFINQALIMLRIAQELGYKVNLDTLSEELQKVIDKREKIEKLAHEIYKRNDLYILGRGLSYPVAREIALKVKEISYIHAEGMMGGELKHGTLALIEEGVPVISLISNQDYDMVSSTREVESRGANTIVVSNELPGDFMIDTENDGKFGLLATTFGQLLTYYIALKRKLPIDKPRNLAKSVTVK
jgi:glutamine---fructose-6-phosphate transaminase (isomerizing)